MHIALQFSANNDFNFIEWRWIVKANNYQEFISLSRCINSKKFILYYKLLFSNNIIYSSSNMYKCNNVANNNSSIWLISTYLWNSRESCLRTAALVQMLP